MKKILLWGAGKCYKEQYERLQRLIKKNNIEVMALINREGEPKVIDGYHVIAKDKIVTYEYDKIIITADEIEAQSIRNDAKELNIDEEKLMEIWLFLDLLEMGERFYNDLIQKQENILKEILAASDEEILSYHWLRQKINEYGIYPFRKEGERINWSRYGVLQVLDEFTKFCNFIGSQEGIKTAIEVGVARGRSSYIICALLSRKNPDLKYTLVDICDQLDSFTRFQKILPSLVKNIPSTSEDYKGRNYDFVFIDADHSYDESMKDYLNIGQYARVITCFHDIYAHEYDHCNGGIVRTWNEVQELTREKEHKIFSSYPGQWMGIGCVIQ